MEQIKDAVKSKEKDYNKKLPELSSDDISKLLNFVEEQEKVCVLDKLEEELSKINEELTQRKSEIKPRESKKKVPSVKSTKNIEKKLSDDNESPEEKFKQVIKLVKDRTKAIKFVKNDY